MKRVLNEIQELRVGDFYAGVTVSRERVQFGEKGHADCVFAEIDELLALRDWLNCVLPVETSSELPAELLDVHAICNQRDYLRDCLNRLANAVETHLRIIDKIADPAVSREDAQVAARSTLPELVAALGAYRGAEKTSCNCFAPKACPVHGYRYELVSEKTSALPSGCHRSHPHEDMNAECERLTEIARSSAQISEDPVYCRTCGQEDRDCYCDPSAPPSKTTCAHPRVERIDTCLSQTCPDCGQSV